MFTETIERLRRLGASLDGSLLDAETWRARHRFALLWSGGLTLFIAVFSLFNPSRPEQWAYVAAALLTLSLAQVRAWSRRLCAVLVAVCFMAAQLYVARFVGNFTLGPLAMIVLTFYQDWVPLVVGCLETLAVIVLAWVDPGFFSHSAAFAREDPLTGMALRGAAILLAAFLSLAIWRSGTQLSASGTHRWPIYVTSRST